MDGSFSCNFDSLDQPVICGEIQPIGSGPWLVELKKKNIKLTDVGQTVEPIEVLLGADVAGRLLTGRREAFHKVTTATHKVRGTLCSETQHLSVYDTLSTGNWLLTFPRRLQPPSSAATMKMEAVSSSEMFVCTNLHSVMYVFLINYDSIHPTEHKTAAYRQYIKKQQKNKNNGRQ
jgi:hypothetical protein